ncbi:hypothetical protein QYF36_006894 [Acer negundo]|nr:hypothetical protein QYF36_006894 [Acer negundo]
MAETKDPEEPTLASKRKPDPKDNNNDAATAAAKDDESDDDNVDSNGESTELDRKGKGILVEKGEDESDDDDSSDRGSQSDGDSDLSDDPFPVIDLDNILPSGTRRKVIQPWNYIANNLGERDDDDSDSDA